MKLHHLAIWVDDMDKMSDFYLKYFEVTSGEKYINAVKKYTSYFLYFNDGGCSIELMSRPDIASVTGKRGLRSGFAHMALTLGSKEAVNNLVERLRTDGYVIEGEPRTTGDGYYESVILDPEGNFVELVA